MPLRACGKPDSADRQMKSGYGSGEGNSFPNCCYTWARDQALLFPGHAPSPSHKISAVSTLKPSHFVRAQDESHLAGCSGAGCFPARAVQSAAASDWGSGQRSGPPALLCYPEDQRAHFKCSSVADKKPLTV